MPKFSTSAARPTSTRATCTRIQPLLHRRLQRDRPQPGGQSQPEGQDHREHEGAERSDPVTALDPEVEQDRGPDHERDHLRHRHERQAAQLDAPGDHRRGMADPARLGQQQGDPRELIAAAEERADRGRRGQDVGGQRHVVEHRVHASVSVSPWKRVRAGAVAHASARSGPSVEAYRTRTRASPWAGAVGPARFRSRPSTTSPIHAGGRAPRPTSTRLPDDVPHHVMQEAVGREADRQALAPGHHPRGRDRAGGRAVPPRRRAERAEVVLAAQGREPGRHRGPVERERRVPGVASQERIGLRRRGRSGRRSACRGPSGARRSPAGASRASSTRTAGGSRAFSARCSAAGATAEAVDRLATCRSACTPASVRLAPVIFTGPPSTRPAASIRRPCTVASPGCTCQPCSSVPS